MKKYDEWIYRIFIVVLPMMLIITIITPLYFAHLIELESEHGLDPDKMIGSLMGAVPMIFNVMLIQLMVYSNRRQEQTLRLSREVHSRQDFESNFFPALEFHRAIEASLNYHTTRTETGLIFIAHYHSNMIKRRVSPIELETLRAELNFLGEHSGLTIWTRSFFALLDLVDGAETGTERYLNHLMVTRTREAMGLLFYSALADVDGRNLSLFSKHFTADAREISVTNLEHLKFMQPASPSKRE